MQAEWLEVKNKLHNVKDALLEAVQAIDAHIADESNDVDDIGEYAFDDLVEMLRKISANYCIASMCEYALDE